jgi:hypothetical protein
MSDLVAPAGEIQFDANEADNDEIRVLVEGIDEIPAEEPKDPALKKTKEEIAAELAATKKSLEEERNRTLEGSALASLVQEVRDLKRAPVAVQGGAQQPGETEEEYQARFNKELYDNPYKTIMEFQMKKLAPEVQRIMVANLQTSKKLLLLDAERGATAKEYQAEIDQEIAKLPPAEALYDADVYAKVHDRVISRHINEIIARKVEEAVKGKGAATPARPANAPAPFNERGSAPAGRGTAPRTVVLTPAEAQYADIKGLKREDYAAYLLRHPEARATAKK